MADGEELSPAMAEMKKRVCDDVDSGGSKRLRAADPFDELGASRPSKPQPSPRENGVSSRTEDFAAAEVTNASSASASAVEDLGDDEGGVLRSDVDEEEEFLNDSDSDEDEDEDDEEDEGDYDSDESDVDFQLGSRRIEKGIVLDKGKNKATRATTTHDYKGKGKAIVQEENEEDSSSDDSEVGVEEEEMFKAKVAALGASDALEDVDLNNILPTRTRRRTIQQPVQAHGDDDRGNGSSEEDEDYVAGGEGDDVAGGK